MHHHFRIITLLFIFVTVLHGFYDFVTSMYTSYSSTMKPFVPNVENPTLGVTRKRRCRCGPIEPCNHATFQGETFSIGNTSSYGNSTIDRKENATEEDNIYSAQGLINEIYEDINLDKPAKKYPQVKKGGWYTPPNNTAVQTVAIIVPYRDRQKHLQIFQSYIHAFLINQQIEYGLFVIEQEGTLPFNRGKLFNVGFRESLKMGKWQCFIFHDVDLLPIDTRIEYRCGKQPRHLSAGVSTLGYKVPYNYIFGGVTAIKREQFQKVNGYSNKYWGWGAEDDDMFRRLWRMNYRITRYNSSIARYAMLNHTTSPYNIKRRQILSNTLKVWKKDGLSSLTYVVKSITWNPLSTHIAADIDEPILERDSKQIKIQIDSMTPWSFRLIYELSNYMYLCYNPNKFHEDQKSVTKVIAEQTLKIKKPSKCRDVPVAEVVCKNSLRSFDKVIDNLEYSTKVTEVEN